MTKRCPRCEKGKPLGEFYIIKRGTSEEKVSTYCKECTRERQKDYSERNAEEIKKKQSARRKTPEGIRKERDRSWLRHYGMTYEQVVHLLKQQKECCASCGDKVKMGKGMHVDHCHSTNRVRGILCSACNLMLGHAKDDPERLRLAAKYLENSQGI